MWRGCIADPYRPVIPADNYSKNRAECGYAGRAAFEMIARHPWQAGGAVLEARLPLTEAVRRDSDADWRTDRDVIGGPIAKS